MLFNDILIILNIFFHVWAQLKLCFELGSKACLDQVMVFLVYDANLVITWSRNRHTKTQVPESQVN